MYTWLCDCAIACTYSEASFHFFVQSFSRDSCSNGYRQCEAKGVVLTITDKVKILELLDKSVSYTIIAEKFGVGKSTVGDIKKSQPDQVVVITQFHNFCTPGHPHINHFTLNLRTFSCVFIVQDGRGAC